MFNEVNEKCDKFTKMSKISFKDYIQTQVFELIYNENLNNLSFDAKNTIYFYKNPSLQPVEVKLNISRSILLHSNNQVNKLPSSNQIEQDQSSLNNTSDFKPDEKLHEN